MNNPRLLTIFACNETTTGTRSGYRQGGASIFLTKISHYHAMDAIEQSELAVDELIPKNVKHWQTAVKAILGSFQSLPTNKYDFVCTWRHHHLCLDKTAQVFSL